MNLRSFAAAILLGLVTASARPAAAEPAAEAQKFMRFEEDAAGSRLQTGVGSYRNKDGVTVDLIGAIHIADKAYYDKLNLRFTRYDALLYEMVGESYEKRKQWRRARERVEAADRAGRDAPAASDSKESLEPRAAAAATDPAGLPTEEDRRQVEEADREHEATGNLSWLHPLYETMEKTLGLTGQMRGIHYGAKNFVHADMSARQFALTQKAKNESFLTLWWKSVVIQMVHPESTPEQPGLLKIMEALCRPDRALGLRRVAARTFGSVEGMLAGLESDDGTVILTERNKVALSVLQEQIKQGKRRLAIFYGAAHLGDMEKRLLAMGFVRTGGEWFTAWDMPPEPKAQVER